ncbi:DUF4393 domain-containing protein [Actinokineospora sp. HUAS TT18]|uniref:DUF4393 domain-containing protein n=1 Tax=Actinokineospora sp. HUAS TT18 TaxID=3447451 RepID=UPI003F5262DB
MSGEIVAAGKALEAAGKKALNQSDKVHEALIEAAKDTPEMAAAAKTMAARVAVKERIKLLIYRPFARMLGVSETYFEDVFPEEMASRISSIPEENLITPPVSIAVPTLLGLSYTFGEPELKSLYLNLLRTASDSRMVDQAHPAFAEIIKQLAPKEAVLLSVVLREGDLPIARVKDMVPPPGAGFKILMSHLISLGDDETNTMTEEPMAPIWLDNWRRLGLVDIRYDTYLSLPGGYEWVTSRPEYLRLSEQSGVNKLDYDRGVAILTNFGKQFRRAIS